MEITFVKKWCLLMNFNYVGQNACNDKLEPLGILTKQPNEKKLSKNNAFLF